MRNTAHKWSLCSLTGLTLALTVSYLILLFSSGAISQGGREAPGTRFEFALIGDMPYDGRQEKEFANLMREIDAADLAFVVHDGDFWYDGSAWTEQLGGLPPCGDETFKHRLGLAQSSKHPFIFVAGDNEWADCHRAKPRAYDPFERLAKLRQMFFHGDQSLGQRTIRLTRQSEDSRYANFRENVRWTQDDVMFATLHVIGSNNNLGRTPEMDAEYSERNAANLAWMRQTFDLATRSGSRAIMIVAQADPRWRSRLYGNRGLTYVRANSAASSRVRRVTSRARRRGGSNTKSGMPRKLARHNPVPVPSYIMSDILSLRRAPPGASAREATELGLPNGYGTATARRVQAPAVRISRGVFPVQRLNACVNALTS
jgi:hypothetical protein